MARQAKQAKKLCIQCKIPKVFTEFYISGGKLFPDGRVNICKSCIKNMVNNDDNESLKQILRAVDKPYLDFIWGKCLNTKDPVGNYFRQIASLPQYKNLTWNDSAETGEVVKATSTVEAKSKLKLQDDIEIPDDLRRKWGREFSGSEILDFEDLYDIWKEGYKIQTPMHESFLKMAIIYNVKATRYAAEGKTKEAESYMKMFKEATSGGKLMPSQMSKADLSDGLDTFGQLVREVEKAVDVIEILPQFKERPRDKVDFAMWCYINYAQDLMGVPLSDYKDAYEFYEKRKQEAVQRGIEGAEEF